MSWRFLSHDPTTGANEWYRYDEGEDRHIIKRTVDLAPVIEANKRTAGEGYIQNKRKDMRLAARIPPDVQLIWLERYGVRAWDRNHKGAVRRLLNSNEWAHLRAGRHFII